MVRPNRMPIAKAPSGQTGSVQGLTLDFKESGFVRLRRIEGQVRGIQRMLDEERDLIDIVEQIASVQEALRGLARFLMVIHLQTAAKDVFSRGTDDEAHAVISGAIESIYRHLR